MELTEKELTEPASECKNVKILLFKCQCSFNEEAMKVCPNVHLGFSFIEAKLIGKDYRHISRAAHKFCQYQHVPVCYFFQSLSHSYEWLIFRQQSMQRLKQEKKRKEALQRMLENHHSPIPWRLKI